MSMNPFVQGSRRWRIFTHWAFAATSGVAGLGAFIVGVGSIATGRESFGDAGATREHVIGAMTMLFIAGVALDLSCRLGRDALALHATRRPEDTEVTGGYVLTAIGAYGSVAGLVLASIATGVPLLGSLLILTIPPVVLLAFRLPKMKQARRERQAARAAAREAARPVVSTRHQRVTRRSTRAQRRG
jgi:hypothetical protein